MTEAQFTRRVIDLARELGLLVHHCTDSRKCDGAGLPDLVLIGRKLLFAELKTAAGDTTPEQDLWLWQLDRAGVMWEIWRPADLEAGTIEQTMRTLA